jgi:uncharacterized protein YoxC
MSKRGSRALGKWIGIGLAVVGILVLLFIGFAYAYPGFREASRDIAIVILAMLQIISVLLLIAILLAILFVVNYVRRLANETVVPQIESLKTKVDDLLDTTQSITGKVQDTTTTVSTTTSYVAERVVTPVIRVAGLMAGARAAARFVARRGAPSDLDK